MAVLTSGSAFFGSESSNEQFLDNFVINAGDEVSFSITLLSEAGGASVSIDNLSTGGSVGTVLPTASPAGMTFASWQVDSSFNEGFSLPDFGIITITEALSDTTADSSFGPGDASATFFDIESPEGQVLTSTQSLGENTIQISFV